MSAQQPTQEAVTRRAARYIVAGHQVIEDAIADMRGGQLIWTGPRAAAPSGPPSVELGEVALVPGQVNAHSHAFQRMIRGRTQHVGAPHEDFWSWRGRMYEAALQLNPDTMYDIARLAFDEMYSVGVRVVGEFHYIHHQPDGTPYEDVHAMSDAVIRAALDARLHITLLRTAYHTAAPGKPAEGAQRRFSSPDVDTFLAQTVDLEARWAHEPRVNIGVAPHSVRAVAPEWLDEIAQAARQRGWPFHIHACEQRLEVAQSIAAYGKTPIALLHDVGALWEGTTLVHGTHLSSHDLDLIAEAGAMVCACPSTERDLGDGFLPALALLKRGVRLCVGSDSHTILDPWEELRLIEYHERLRYERRCVLTEAHARWYPEHEGARGVADLLLPIGSAHGAQALGVPVERLGLVEIDLTHPAMRGADAHSLTSYITLSMPTGAVRA